MYNNVFANFKSGLVLLQQIIHGDVITITKYKLHRIAVDRLYELLASSSYSRS